MQVGVTKVLVGTGLFLKLGELYDVLQFRGITVLRVRSAGDRVWMVQRYDGAKRLDWFVIGANTEFDARAAVFVHTGVFRGETHAFEVDQSLAATIRAGARGV